MYNLAQGCDLGVAACQTSAIRPKLESDLCCGFCPLLCPGIAGPRALIDRARSSYTNRWLKLLSLPQPTGNFDCPDACPSVGECCSQVCCSQVWQSRFLSVHTAGHSQPRHGTQQVAYSRPGVAAQMAGGTAMSVGPCGSGGGMWTGPCFAAAWPEIREGESLPVCWAICQAAGIYTQSI